MSKNAKLCQRCRQRPIVTVTGSLCADCWRKARIAASRKTWRTRKRRARAVLTR